MARFTKTLRQQIIGDFAAEHGGLFVPSEFVEEVRATGPDHPAYEWFTWDTEKAALEHQIWQAREFAKGLIITFSVETISRKGTIKVLEVEAPFALSPVFDRKDGGGYVITDPTDPEHMKELCYQAAIDLERWLRRYAGAVAYAKGSVEPIKKQLLTLRSV